MDIAIVGGTGREAQGMALRWARAGHTILIGSRNRARAEQLAAGWVAAGGGTIRGGTNHWAVRRSDLTVLCVPHSAHRSVVEDLGPDLASRMVLDVTVPLKPPKFGEVHLPRGNSAALETRELLGPKARIAAALHHISASSLADPAAQLDMDVMICADDPSTLATVSSLVNDLGARPLHAGPLKNAVALEALTPVLIHIGMRHRSPRIGIRVVGV